MTEYSYYRQRPLVELLRIVTHRRAVFILRFPHLSHLPEEHSQLSPSPAIQRVTFPRDSRVATALDGIISVKSVKSVGALRNRSEISCYPTISGFLDVP